MPVESPNLGITWALCEAFVQAADNLILRRAGEIPDTDIDAFVALDWMEWHAGALRLTPLGQMALLRTRNRLAEAAPA